MSRWVLGLSCLLLAGLPAQGQEVGDAARPAAAKPLKELVLEAEVASVVSLSLQTADLTLRESLRLEFGAQRFREGVRPGIDSIAFQSDLELDASLRVAVWHNPSQLRFELAVTRDERTPAGPAWTTRRITALVKDYRGKRIARLDLELTRLLEPPCFASATALGVRSVTQAELATRLRFWGRHGLQPARPVVERAPGPERRFTLRSERCSPGGEPHVLLVPAPRLARELDLAPLSSPR